MANVFDQFDAPASAPAPAAPVGNVFDQFDAPKPAAPAPAPQSTLSDVAESGGSGLARGVAGLIQTPVTVARLAKAGANKIFDKLEDAGRYVVGAAPVSDADRAQQAAVRSAHDFGGQAQDATNTALEGVLHQPTTTAGKFANSVGEAIPGAAIMPAAGVGGAVANALRVGVPAGIGAEAAGEATAGTPYEGVARAVGGAAGGLAGLKLPGGKLPELVAPKVIPPTTQELKDAASTGYETARDIPVQVNPAAVSDVAATIQNKLENKGFIKEFAPGTHAILSKLQNVPEGAVSDGTSLEATRQALAQAARSANPQEAAAGASALNGYSNFLENIPKSAVISGDPDAVAGAFKEARGNYAAAQRSNKITGDLDDAATGIQDRAALQAASANSGANVDNALRQGAKNLLRSKSGLRGFSDEEKDALFQVVKGTATANVARHVGNLLGGGGGMHQVLTGAVGTLAAGPAGLAAPLAGMAAKAISSNLTQNQVKALDALVRQRSPLFQKMVSDAQTNPKSAMKLNAFLRSYLPSEAGIAMQPQSQPAGVVQQ